MIWVYNTNPRIGWCDNIWVKRPWFDFPFNPLWFGMFTNFPYVFFQYILYIHILCIYIYCIYPYILNTYIYIHINIYSICIYVYLIYICSTFNTSIVFLSGIFHLIPGTIFSPTAWPQAAKCSIATGTGGWCVERHSAIPIFCCKESNYRIYSIYSYV